ncbi:GSCOCG00009333001-RA-CDS, partial [Cotesia congregata]
CTINTECIVNNSVCSDKVCKCRKDYMPLSNHKCLSKILKRECITDYDCHTIKFSSCSEQSKCTCNQKYVALDETKCAALLGEYCSDDNSCWGANTLCHDNKCCCKQHFKDNFNYQCVPMYLGESCENNDDCMMIQHAQCSTNKKCFCQEAYIAVNARACKALLGENCEQDADCYAENSICMDNKCRCKNFFAADPSNSKSKLEASCVSDEDCWEIKHAKCSTEKKCDCRANNLRLNETYCAPSLGGFCWKNETCVTRNALCIDSECRCRKNYSASEDQCLPVLIGLHCSEDIDCAKIRFAKCSKNNYCVCSLNTVVVNDISCEPVLNSYCTTDSDCLLNNSVCKNNKCQCRPEYVAINSIQCIQRK